jgi:aryl-alcohol dehydrogenase-like predicted oxidoreductase
MIWESVISIPLLVMAWLSSLSLIGLPRNREKQVEVATKWGYTYTANYDINAKVHEVKEHSIGKLNEQWQQSRLAIPALSTYQIHSATFETGVLENQKVLHRLNELKNEFNLIIGLTTTGENQAEVLQKAMEVAVDGEQLFEAFQVTYNIFDQSTLAVCRELAAQGKRIIVKEALANGRVFPNEKYPHYQKAYQLLNDLAQKYKVGIDAIALRFCMDSLPVYSVLSGAATSDQLSENLKALTFRLSTNDLEQLKALAIRPKFYWQERKQLDWN